MGELEDANKLDVKESIVLQKFEGDPEPENEFERVHIENGEVVKVEKIEQGEVVETTNYGEVE